MHNYYEPLKPTKIIPKVFKVHSFKVNCKLVDKTYDEVQHNHKVMYLCFEIDIESWKKLYSSHSGVRSYINHFPK